MAKTKKLFCVTILNKTISEDQLESNVEQEFQAESREAMEDVLATFALQHWDLMPLGSKMPGMAMKIVSNFFGNNRKFSYTAKEYDVVSDKEAGKMFEETLHAARRENTKRWCAAAAAGQRMSQRGSKPATEVYSPE